MNDLEFKKDYSVLILLSHGVTNPSPPQVQKTQENLQNSEFAAPVRQSPSKDSQLDFPKHVAQRLESRSIEFSPERLIQLSGAVEKARAKGVRDVLIPDGSMAFIVNISSSTVAIMLNDREMTDNVSTNTDGAVVL